jgi:hypothetical protein
MPIQDRAVQVLATIQGELVGEAPIIFVCHSYGGLLVKQMLFTAFGRSHNEYGSLAERVKGVVFLSTPHNGSRIADYVQALRAVLWSSGAIAELKQNAPYLRELAGWYRNYSNTAGWKIRVFFETMNTRGVRVVDEDSADPHVQNVTPIGIDADHIGICKPPRADVRISQTNALLGEIVGLAKSSAIAESPPSVLATLIATTDPVQFERLMNRYELQLRADPGNQELIKALSNYTFRNTDGDGYREDWGSVIETVHRPRRYRAFGIVSALVVGVLVLAVFRDTLGHIALRLLQLLSW